MHALKDFVVVESLDSDLSKTKNGIYIQNKSSPNVGHYKVLSVGNVEKAEIKEGDTVWALVSNVSKSSNFEDENIGIVKYVNIMAVD